MAGVFMVASDFVPMVWSRVTRMLERDQTPIDAQHLYRLLMIGERQLWVAADIPSSRSTHYLAVLTTGLVARGAQRYTLVVHLVAGKRIPKWIDSAVDIISSLVKRVGTIDEVQIYARKGWMIHAVRFKVLTNLGVKVTFSRDRPTQRGHRERNRVNPEIGINYVSR
jgi:hypothetical protein